MKLIVGDVETTGLGHMDGVVEIAWTEVDDNLNILSKVYSRINPGKAIPPQASAVHGIFDSDVAACPTLDVFHAGLGSPLQGSEVVLIAHNASFDVRFFKRIANIQGTLCTLRLARNLYPEAPNHKLQTLRENFGLQGGEAHSAAGDVEVTLNLLRLMCLDTNSSVSELFQLNQLPTLVKKMPFGKHKGVPIQGFPLSYVRWAMGNMTNMDDNLRHTFVTTFNL
jgi:DNA polymerase III epsilon subunit-like protein